PSPFRRLTLHPASLNETGHDALAAHLRLLEVGGGNGPVESGAQLLGRLQRQLDRRTRTGIKVHVDEVERDDIAELRMARVVISNYRLPKSEPFGPALCHTLCARALDDACAYVPVP